MAQGFRFVHVGFITSRIEWFLIVCERAKCGFDFYSTSYSRKAEDRTFFRKINPSDCVDMECDAKKKVLVKDFDGTFLGGVGAVIPQVVSGVCFCLLQRRPFSFHPRKRLS